MTLRLSHRIGLMAPIAVAGILLIVGIFQVEQRTAAEYGARVERHRSADDALRGLEIEFLQNRRAEKDFLLRRDEKYVAAHKEISAKAEKTLETLGALVDNPATRADLQTISDGYATYQKSFATLAEASIALGLDPSSGREGAMRTAVHAIEELLKTVDDKGLQVSMLTMRRHEKDFIMRRDAKYVAKHAQERAAFAKTPAEKFGGAANQATILEALAAYGKAFDDYAAIAATEAAARQGVSDAFAAVEPVFDTMSAGIAADKVKAETESASALQAAHTVAIAAILAAIATIAATVLLIGRSVSRPIVATTRAMTVLAGGDTVSAIPYAGRRDEIGEMAGAVEVFRQAAIANRRLEAEAAENRARAEAERVQLQEEAEAAAQARLQQATSGLAGGLRRLASGDLSFQLTEPFAADFEQLRHDLNSAVAQLGETLGAVAQSSGSIDDGSREISVSADDLSKRTEQQAASLEETAAALDQITANVANSTKRADEARSVAGEANRSAQKSGEIVAGAIEAMKRIENSSGQISNIIGVIDEIAFQTNLLALNAGVEAARAGEAGKGFAVVAQEVRELAQRSAQAAREIKDLIRNSTTEVEGGVRLVQDTGASLQAIGLHVATINQHMDAIAISAREQSVGLSEVNTAVNQMDQVTQRNAAMVEETNAASASLANEAVRLREQISRFVLPTVSGGMRDLKAVHRRMETAARTSYRPVSASQGNAALKQEWTEF
ncbi:HAMP domain-containing methyl-accepting chemotaxis protein [Shinella sp. CPCC 101442]|uniref:methyl-accepting chemotaxis protein n=1 Tax=Shinella sp. CPCC 101442 TaxID=2932265 RepID=UPI002153620A|nr:HAMP domain-containing methyl-accepting chemotaxis protein [Shinella sp. CPCC 101442]MCR6499185.1 HAMP domain-containing methyl-accepting chemotaxis protein [Shinella sp. CPCC 101442]